MGTTKYTSNFAGFDMISNALAVKNGTSVGGNLEFTLPTLLLPKGNTSAGMQFILSQTSGDGSVGVAEQVGPGGATTFSFFYQSGGIIQQQAFNGIPGHTYREYEVGAKAVGT